MSLASILNVPASEQDFALWSFFNADLHTLVQDALARLSIATTRYVLDPIAFDDQGDQWLARHQQAHDDVNSILNVAGADLSSVDFKARDQLQAWIHLHETEHLAWNQILGL